MYRSFLAFILIVTSVTESFGNSCAHLFFRPLETLERVNRENNSYLSNDASVEYLVMMLKDRHRKKAEKLLYRVHKGDIASEKDLFRVSEELVLLLYGHKSVIDNYFFKSKDQRRNEAIRHSIRIQLMEKGLKSFLENRPPEWKVTLWIKVKKNVRKILQSNALSWLQIPFGIPRRENKVMEETLLQKVIWDGISAHQKEVDRYFSAQVKVEAYNTLRHFYSVIIIGTLTVFGYQTGFERQNIERKEKIEFVSNQLDYLATNLPKEARALKDANREGALEAAIEEYRGEFREEPSAKEIEEMRKIIFD